MKRRTPKDTSEAGVPEPEKKEKKESVKSLFLWRNKE